MVHSKSSKVKTLKTIMEENGHKHIDILKVPSGGYPLRGPTLSWLRMWQGWLVLNGFDVFFCGVVFACNVLPKGSRTHMVVKLVRAHTQRV